MQKFFFLGSRYTLASKLPHSGLASFPEGEFLEVARQQVEELEVIRTSDPPLPLTWVDLAPTGQQAFAYQNHCFE
jgi:hypothetical protein